MCGLVGMISKWRGGFNQNNFEFFNHLLYMDALRGEDSTGVFAVDNIGNVRIAKSAEPSAKFMVSDEYKALRTVALQRGWAFIGHNRKATRGAINDENAHPFWVDDKLVLVHNGTMFGDHKKLADVEVDSHAIAHVLAEESDPEKALQKINAAYALIWYDIQNKRLHMVRNDQRPLCWVETHSAIYFASEGDMLAFTARRTNTEMISKGDGNFGRPWQLTAGTLDTYQLNSDKSMTSSTRKIDLTYRYVAPPSTSTKDDDDDVSYYTRYMRDMDEDNVMVLTPSELRQLKSIREAKEEVREELKGLPPPPEVNTKHPLIPYMLPNPLPGWAPSMRYSDYTSIKDLYATGQKVRVEMVDYLADAADRPNTVMVTGRVMDERGIMCVFPIPLPQFKAITHPDSLVMKNNKAIFNVEVNAVCWRRRDTTVKVENINTTDGCAYIHGASARIMDAYTQPTMVQ